MEVMVTTGTVKRAKLQSNRHHQQPDGQTEVIYYYHMPVRYTNMWLQGTDFVAWYFLSVGFIVY